MESIPTNLPLPLGMFGITARDASSGALVQMYVGANGNINNYNHTGTMTVGNEYYWSFSYITAS